MDANAARGTELDALPSVSDSPETITVREDENAEGPQSGRNGTLARKGAEQIQRFSEDERMVYLGKMVSSISHELNNRLSSVVGFAELLSLKSGPPEIKRLVEKLRTYTESLRHLADGLSGFSKVKDEALKTSSPEPFIRQAFDLAACKAKTTGVKMILQIEGDLPKIMLIGPEFRLGLFIILDAMVTNMAESSHAPLPPRDSLLLSCSDNQSGLFVIDINATQGSEPFWRATREPNLDGTAQAQYILLSLGVKAGWRPLQGGGWKFRLEAARS